MFIAALCMTRTCCAATIDGTIMRDTSNVFVEQLLSLELRSSCVRARDSLSCEVSEHARRLVESRRAAKALLPPNSLDLDHTELMFSKIMQLRWSLACQRFWDRLGVVIESVTSEDAVIRFAHCAYRLYLE